MRKIKKSNRSIRKAIIAERERRQEEFLDALKNPPVEEDGMQENLKKIVEQIRKQKEEQRRKDPWDQKDNEWGKWIYEKYANEKLY